VSAERRGRMHRVSVHATSFAALYTRCARAVSGGGARAVSGGRAQAVSAAKIEELASRCGGGVAGGGWDEL